jgi:hypothetical protein
MGDPCQGVFLYKKDPDVAGLGRVEVQRGDYVLQQAFKSLTLLPAGNKEIRERYIDTLLTLAQPSHRPVS